MGSSSNRLLHSWNAFQANSPNNAENAFLTNDFNISTFGGNYGRSPSNYLRTYSYRKADLIKAVINRIAMDASMVAFQHLKINPQTGDQQPVDSGLIKVLTKSANLDQTGRAFMFDVFWSLLDEGVIAVVPIDTTVAPNDTGAFDILSARVGRILQWYPAAVRVRVYNEKIGLEQDLIIEKSKCVIIESPFYSVMNEPNQTLRLLEQKISLMNSQDNRAASGKLNGFIQFPYSTKSSARLKQAGLRKSQIESEMANSKYGLATLDANEKYVSAGMGIQNNLLNDIRELQQDFYNQTGITQAILDGTATEQQTLVYYHRCVDVVLQWFVDSVTRICFTDTAISQGQILRYYRDPFKLVPVEQLANAADIMTRNAILTPNEIRDVMGRPPHPDPLANQLFNRNIADANLAGGTATPGQMSVVTSDQGTGSIDPNNPPAVQNPYGMGLVTDNEKSARSLNYVNTHNIATGQSTTGGSK